jgi:hypothetical protein
MAEINYKEEKDPTKKNKFGVVSGADLEAPPILNLNPLDIEFVNGKNPEEVTRKWLVFSTFLEKKNITTDINSLEGRKKISLELIKEFNTSKTSFWATSKKSITNPLDINDIKAVQKFNQITDPNVQVDGWVGTQTVQLLYPRINFLLITYKNYERNKYVEYPPKEYPDDTLVPIIWGNKRFVIPINSFLLSQNSDTSYQYWRPYSPSTDKDKLPWNTMSRKLRTSFPSNSTWDKLDNTVDIENTLTINQNTSKEQQQKTNLQNQTKLINSLR